MNNEHFEIVSKAETSPTSVEPILEPVEARLPPQSQGESQLKCKKHGKPLIQIGNVVIVKSDTCRRSFWKLGIINKLLTGKNGNVRAAIVRVPESQRNNKLLRRSVKHLFPIEV